MTVVTFANPKGGVGKTTSAMLFAEYCLENDLRVVMMDLDPNKNLVNFCNTRKNQGIETPLEVIPRPNDLDDVIQILKDANRNSDIVVVDLEGSRDKVATLALSQTDMAIIPLNGSAMEARQAAAAMKLVNSTSAMINRKISQWCLFTRVNSGIAWADELEVRTELETNGLPVFESRLELRSTYTRIFKDSLFINEMISREKNKATSNKLKKAKNNSHAVCGEIAKKLIEVTA